MSEKKQKQTKRDKIKKAILKGDKVFDKNITLYIHKSQKNNKDTEKPEKNFVFVVPKTVLKKAHERNLLKRRAKGILNKHTKKTKKGNIYVFLFKKNITNNQYDKLEDSILKILIKANEIRNN